MRVFGGERIASIMQRLSVDENTPIENRMISKSLESAQKKVEGFNFDTRKNVVQYDDVMNRHRTAVYTIRKEILRQPKISKRIKLFIDEEVHELATSPLLTTDQFEDILLEVFPFDEPTLDRLFDTEADKFEQTLKTAAHEYYDSRVMAFTPDIFHKIERDVYFQVLDTLWMQHLENMDHLREGIHWMSVGQQDPLVEYRRRGQVLFDEMQRTLRHDAVRTLSHAQPMLAENTEAPVETELTRAARNSVDNIDQINEAEQEFGEEDFDSKKSAHSVVKKQTEQRKKQRKKERQQKKVARRKR